MEEPRGFKERCDGEESRYESAWTGDAELRV